MNAYQVISCLKILTKTYVVGTQKNRHNETVFQAPNSRLNLMGKKIFTILHLKTVFVAAV